MYVTERLISGNYLYKRLFSAMAGPTTAAFNASTNNLSRLNEVQLAAQCDLVIVVGSPNSSNSNRLREVAQNLGVESYMVDNAGELKPAWLKDKNRIGVTAGASAPDVLVQEVIARLKTLGADTVSEVSGVVGNVVFPLPKGLQAAL